MKILAIETSCDETAISILQINSGKFKILSNIVSSQVKIHAKWGGVVPSLAKREHLKNLPLILKKALKEAKIKTPPKSIDLIAVTAGPGLEPALWTGINMAKELAAKWKKPLLPINHMEGHLFSVFLKENKSFKFSAHGGPALSWPAIILLVSGGHTELILISAPGRPALGWKYKLLGSTRDDAAGEAFDKVAKMMKLGYPGGPIVAKLASNYRGRTSLVLPRPMINDNSPTGKYDFSFSGLKTAVLYKLKEFPKITASIKKEMCHEFQQAVIDVLIAKTMRAVREHNAKTILIGGGVAANNELRRQFEKVANNCDSKYMLLLPEMKFTGDNATMIALAAYFRWLALSEVEGKKTSPSGRGLKANGNLKIA